MSLQSPLASLHERAGALLAPYGPPVATPTQPETQIHLVQTYGLLDAEYASLRKGCVLIDQPQRATLEITGGDRADFLNRMLTQELKGFAAFQSRRSFWLSRKGRIDADLRLVELPERTLIDVDAHAASRTLSGLSAYVIAEDVTITDRTGEFSRLSLHGPTALALLAAEAEPVEGPSPGELTPGRACRCTIAGARVVADRDDTAGEIGVELLVAGADAEAVFAHLLSRAGVHDGHENEHHGGGQTGALAAEVRLRAAGWHAWNIARIEAGTPVYNIDFGPESLPAETGAMDTRVSLTKGCYLGQEIVARMHSRGQAKQRLVALRCSPTAPGASEDVQPETGAAVLDPATGAEVGRVTSASLSPMLGLAPICLAQVRGEHATPGRGLRVVASSAFLDAFVQPTLRFWPKA